MSDTLNHPGDGLELYALGMLEAEERDAVDAHVRACDGCATQLGNAELTVASMLETTLSAERMSGGARVTRPASRNQNAPWALRFATAAAAVFALTTGVVGVQYATLNTAASTGGELVRAMITTHFVHAQFRSPRGAPLDAKVVYERHGRWYAVLVAGDAGAWRVATIERAGAAPHIVPQAFVRSGGVAMLRISATHPLVAMQLLDGGGRVVGTTATPNSGGR